MTKAICTPTATREEFESILRELDDVGVKWESGDSPSDTWCLDYHFNGCVISYKWDGEKNLMCGYFKSSREKQLPRAEFISAIKRDFAPKIDCSYPTEIKEKPKMNYNKMTKAELIKRLENSRTKSDYDALYKCSEETYEESGEIKKKNSALEKANAEQAETIMDLNSRLENSGNISDGWRKTAGDASGLVKELRAENTRIKRLAAQILCADVLDGN